MMMKIRLQVPRFPGRRVMKISSLSQKIQRQNNLATFIAYTRFCRLHPAYHQCWANQIRIFAWLDERRVEMFAECRPHWVPSTRDFEQAERDCADDFVKP
jgi:hypothetical protein